MYLFKKKYFPSPTYQSCYDLVGSVITDLEGEEEREGLTLTVSS